MRLKVLIGKALYYSVGLILVCLFVRGSRRSRVMVVCGSKILLVRTTISSQRWNLPGGGIKKGESAVAGARRELLEETGHSASEKDLKLIGQLSQKTLGCSYEAICFFLPAHREFVIPKRLEILEAGWFERDHLPDNLHPLVVAALQLEVKSA